MIALKKPVSLLLTLLLLLSVVAAAPVPIFAADSSSASTGDGDLTEYTEGNYKYTVSNNKATITKYIGHAAKVVIPSTLGGYPVECIGHMDDEGVSTYNSDDRDELYVSVSGHQGHGYYYANHYNKGAFYNNTTMRSLTIPNCVKTIGFYAFYNCSNLTDVIISDGVQKIWSYAFKGCTSFKELTLPKSIDFIANQAFQGSKFTPSSLGSGVYYEDGITDLTLYTDWITDSYSLPFSSVETLTIAYGSKTIPDSAFVGFHKLKEVTIPNTVTRIEDKAFYLYGDHWPLSGSGLSMPRLRSIELPPSVQYIGKEAFKFNSALYEIILHKGLQSIDDWAFEDCTDLHDIILPNNLSYLGKGVFYNCTGLGCIDVPGTVGTIQKFTFVYSGVYDVTLYQGITVIEKGAFSCYSEDIIADPNYYKERVTIDTESHQPVFTLFGGPGAPVPYATQTEIQSITCASSVTSIGGTKAFGENGYNSEAIGLHSPEGAETQIYALGEHYDWSKCENPIKYKDEDELAGGGPLSGLTEIFGCLGGSEALFSYLGEDINVTLPELLEDNSVLKNIGINAFKNLDIESIGFPNSVEDIGSWAFSGCKELGRAVLSASLQEVGDYAFENCSNLSDIELPEGVTALGDSVFKGCSSLGDIELPEGLRYLGEAAFEECSGLQDIKLPDSFIQLRDSVFSNCTSLQNIDLPNGLTTIGDKAFSACKSIVDMDFPSALKTIKDSTFTDCINLDNIELPEGATSLGNAAFGGCDSFTDIDLPDSITSIGAAAFENCKNLRKVELPNSITELKNWVFSNCSDLSDIELPDSITSIGKSAFENCSSLTSLEIPDGVTSIGKEAFKNCSSLTSIEIPEGVTSIDDEVFKGCTNLESITIPESVTSIGDNVFNGCTSLKTIELPDDITSIGKEAFKGCTNLKSFNLPEGITSIGDSAFIGCSQLTAVEIPDTVTNIGAETFAGCVNLKSVIIPESVTSIDDYAFDTVRYSFGGLNDLVIYGTSTSAAKTFASKTSIPFATYSISGEEVSVSAFRNNKSETPSYTGNKRINLVIPPEIEGKPVTSIAANTFNENSTDYSYLVRIESAVLPENLERIEGNAFENCIKLTSLTIPDSVDYISDDAFSGCTNIKTLTVSGNGSFDYDNLPKENVYTLNVTGTAVKNSAFREMTRMRYLNIAETVKSIGNRSFEGCFFRTVTISDAVESIGEYAFADCLALNTINLPDGLTSLSTGVFSNCEGIRSISIPDSVETIGVRAFEYCHNLESVDFSEKIKTIGTSSFIGCAKLEELNIPSTVETIGVSAFDSCTKLESAYIWGRNTNLGDNAFKDCPDATIYAYDSSPADTYASENNISFIPLMSINKGDENENAQLIGTQSVEDDGNNFGLNQSEYNNFELLGVQIKSDAESKDLRFIAVINEGIVNEATNGNDIEDYGFVVAKCSKTPTSSAGEDNIKKITVDNPKALAVSCKNSSNRICGDYGIYNKPTKYKYTTLAINDVDEDQGVVARFYVKMKSGRVYYGKYGTDYTGCATTYNQLESLSRGENSVVRANDWENLNTFVDE